MAKGLNFEWRLRWLAVAVVAIYWGAMFAGTHLHIPGPELPHAPGDKTMHFVAYAGLAFLWLVAAATFGRVTWFMYLIVLAGAALYGAVDEVSQSMVGRDMDIADWRFDLMGAAIGSIAFAAVYAMWNLRQGRSVEDRRTADRHRGKTG
jgi:VanZ family protein